MATTPSTQSSAQSDSSIAHYIWAEKYRYTPPGTAQGPGPGTLSPEQRIEDSWRRVAGAIATVEGKDQALWRNRFYSLLEDYRFLPGGRILAGAGTALDVTLFNCFVMGVIDDDLESIFQQLKQGALTMQAGGGVGYDFSTLRPRGSRAERTGNIATGPVSFMGIWDAMCATILTIGARRGAMLASLRCDHPDILEFIDAKRSGSRLQHFNLSVQITDEFMLAVRQDRQWPLVFPVGADHPEAESTRLHRLWSGSKTPVPVRVFKTLKARELWHKLMQANYDSSEPGVLFTDHINQQNNLYYREQITTTNPCGEIPLPAYGACDLGSINLPRFVLDPFSEKARLDYAAIEDRVPDAVRMLDNVIDLSHFPLPQQAQQARGSRRIGLGMTGLADTLAMLRLHYGTADARREAGKIMQTICHTAYRASIRLAREKASFPFFECEPYAAGNFVKTLPNDIQQGIRKNGIRNSHLTAIAPTGTISLLAGNVSSGMEPIFEREFQRRVLSADGRRRSFHLKDYAWRLWQQQNPDTPTPPDVFVTATELTAEQHLLMQAALQPYVDNSISKTINVPVELPFEDFKNIYTQAWELGLKGCTTFRVIPAASPVLSKPG